MLTNKQERFVEEYLVDLNATQAAIRAGYSKHTAAQIGDENLKKPQIAAAVRRRMLDRQQRTEVTQDMVIAELAKIAFANIGDVLGRDGSVLPLDHLGHDSLAAIASYEETKITKEGKEVGKRRRVRLHDKLGALAVLARHLGMMDGAQHRRDGDDPMRRLIMQAQDTSLQPTRRLLPS